MRVAKPPTRPSGWGRLGRATTTGAGCVLVLVYIQAYLGNPARPGRSHGWPLGWWGWWDQSLYLRSARAFADGSFSPDQHWYPLAYPLIGAPFVGFWPRHAFFVPDLLCLVAAYVAFLAFAEAAGVAAGWAALLFLLSSVAFEVLQAVWAEPWTSTLSTALIWWLLALTARHLAPPTAERRRNVRVAPSIATGVLAVCIVFTRPIDALVVAIWGAGVAGFAVRDRAWQSVLALWPIGAGMLLASVPAILLWLRIYGAAPSPYVIQSRSIGFEFHALWWKTALLLLTPQPWFPAGSGMIARFPWLLFGIAGILALPWIVRGRALRLLALLAVMIVGYCVLFFAYVDLLPTGLWRFLNIHYFAWAIPGYALLAALLVRDLAGKRWPRGVAVAAIIGTAALLCVRVVPRAVSADEPAKAVDFAGPMPPFVDTFLMGALAVRDANGVLHDYSDFRGLIYPGGVRVIGIRRELTGPVEWVPGSAPQGFERTIPDARWAELIRLAWPPRWIRRAPRPAIPVPLS